MVDSDPRLSIWNSEMEAALVRGQSGKYLSAVAHFRGQLKGKNMGVTRLFPSDEVVAVQGPNDGTSV